MSDILKPIRLENILYRIVAEYKKVRKIYAIDEKIFYKSKKSIKIFNEDCDLPLGPAAGPHTQLAPNILAAYLSGARYFELKTVQVLDNLEIEKPCIEAENEGYNTEWSTELTIKQAYTEYVKAWLILHLVNKIFALSQNSHPFIFNMSVGYDIKGIKSPKVDWFIENLKDASDNGIFKENKNKMLELIQSGFFNDISKVPQNELYEYAQNISSKICSTIAVSTMHGCPPDEIEEIARYLIEQKKLNLLIKLNPTLHGYDYVRNTFDKLGFKDIELEKKSFENDLSYDKAIEIIKKTKKTARENSRFFGIKLSNTLEVKNTKKLLPGDYMYLSGIALLPLTISLANKLANEFNGDIHISYSGGANLENAHKIASTGIMPITLCTDLLKPKGYDRLSKIAKNIEDIIDKIPTKIDLKKLKTVAEEILNSKPERKKIKKVDIPLPIFDCISCGFCVEVCPNRANIQLEFEVEGLKKKTQIIHLDGMCNECGNCATFCPHNNGKPFKDKLTVFADKDDFENSKNIGFYFRDGNLKLRTVKDAKIYTQISKVAKIIKDEYDFLLKND